MANNRIADFNNFMNKQTKLQQKVAEYLESVQAQIDLIVEKDKGSYDQKNRLHIYLLGVSNLLSKAVQLNQTGIRELLRYSQRVH